MMHLSPELLQLLPPGVTFDQIMALEGEVFRDVKNRRTLAFCLGGRRFFIKTFRATGWPEICKNLGQLRLPVVSAAPEWRAVAELEKIGLPTVRVVGRGGRGWNPAARESFVITEALEGMVTLEELAEILPRCPLKTRLELKRQLIRKVAETARRFHGAGMNHRDFYLCHFMVKNRDWADWAPGHPLKLYLIDLHRVQKRKRVPRRWLVKDLAGLLFSALDVGLSSADLLRFVRDYSGENGVLTIRNQRRMWREAAAKAVRLYRGFHNREPELPRLLRFADEE